MKAMVDCKEDRYQPIVCKRQALERTNDSMRSTTHGTSNGNGVRPTAPCGLHYNILSILESALCQFWSADAMRNCAVWDEICPGQGCQI